MASRSRQRCCATPRTSHAKTKPRAATRVDHERRRAWRRRATRGLRRVSGLVSQDGGRALTVTCLEGGCPERECRSPPARRRRRARSACRTSCRSAPRPSPNFDHLGDGDDAEPCGTRQQPQRMTGVEHQTERSEQQHLPRAAYLASRREHPDGKDRPADGERQKSPVQHVAEDEQRHQDRRQRRAAPAAASPCAVATQSSARARTQAARQERGAIACTTQQRVLETVGCPPLYPIGTTRIGQRLAEQPDLRQVLRQIRDRWERDDKKGRHHEKRRRDEQRPSFSYVEAQRVITESLDVMLSEHSDACGTDEARDLDRNPLGSCWSV